MLSKDTIKEENERVKDNNEIQVELINEEESDIIAVSKYNFISN